MYTSLRNSVSDVSSVAFRSVSFGWFFFLLQDMTGRTGDNPTHSIPHSISTGTCELQQIDFPTIIKIFILGATTGYNVYLRPE